jgi:hypothetical protein
VRRSFRKHGHLRRHDKELKRSDDLASEFVPTGGFSFGRGFFLDTLKFGNCFCFVDILPECYFFLFFVLFQ